MTTPQNTTLTELQYDSTNAAALPPGARYAAYVNGEFANIAAVKARFPKARTVGIDVLGDAWLDARMIDWEPGNVGGQDPDRLRKFVTEREAYREHTATVYTDRSDLPGVEEILKGVWHVLLVATLDGTKLTGQRTEAGNLIIGTQFAGGLHAAFDTSEVLASWR